MERKENKGDARPLRDILFIPADHYGTAFHQCYLPTRWINEHTNLEAVMTEPLDYKPEDIAKADLVVLQRGVNENGVRIVSDLRNQSIATVLDIDDNFWNLPSTHQVRRLWPSARLRVLDKMVEACDGVTCHSEGLKQFLHHKFPEHKQKIYRMPALADFSYEPIRKKRDEIRIGWVGASQHKNDINPVVHAVNNIIRRNPKVKLVTMGLMDFTIESLIPWWRRETYAFVPSLAYQEVMGTLDLDITIAAVSGETFHESQSARKFLDYSCAKAATIASHSIPYTLELSEDAPIWWVNKHKVPSWEREIEAAMERDFRGLGQRAYEYCKDRYDGPTHIHKWEDIYTQIFEGKKGRLIDGTTKENASKALAKEAKKAFRTITKSSNEIEVRTE